MDQPLKPISIKVVAILGTVLSVLSISLYLLDAGLRQFVIDQYGAEYHVYTFQIMLIVHIFAFWGYWKMRKWGVYLYALTAATSFMYDFVFFEITLVGVFCAAVFYGVPIGIGFRYINRMT